METEPCPLMTAICSFTPSSLTQPIFTSPANTCEGTQRSDELSCILSRKKMLSLLWINNVKLHSKFNGPRDLSNRAPEIRGSLGRAAWRILAATHPLLTLSVILTPNLTPSRILHRHPFICFLHTLGSRWMW
jgi:hypothetical protein